MPPSSPVLRSNFDAALGKLLRERREAAGLTQLQAAKGIGVTFQQLQKYEKGANRISVERFYDLTRTLGVSAGRLIDEATASGDPGDEDHMRREADDMVQLMRRIESPRERALLLGLARQMATPHAVALGHDRSPDAL